MLLQDIEIPTREPLNRRLVISLLLSLLLHSLLIAVLQTPPNPGAVKPIEVTLVSTKKNKPQIVSPSALPESEPLETARVSDKNTRTDVESIRRGDMPQTPSPSIATQAKPATEAQQPKNQMDAAAQPEKPKSSPQLKLRDEKLLSQFGQLPVEQPAKEPEPRKISDAQRASKFSQAQPFQRSDLSIFRQGTPDFLPDIQDGDLTLLNAKADRHAIFVRRVALQVFGSLRSLSWQELSRSQIGLLQNHSVVEAIMSPTGKLLSVTIKGISGSAAFDTIVEKAAKDGTWDQNPPKTAQAADGNIHFIFYSKTWSRTAGDTMREQRWIMLGTGLL